LRARRAEKRLAYGGGSESFFSATYNSVNEAVFLRNK
jgi:hypothetical protein